MNYDFIIVGQGLAGTLLSYELIKLNQSVLVIDQYIEGASSLMAAGIINPVTGRRLIKSWMFDELLPVLESTYHELEDLLSKPLLHPLPIIKLLKTPAEINEFAIKHNEPAYRSYLESNHLPLSYLNHNAFIDSITINHAFRVNGDLLLASYRQHLIQSEQLLDEVFNSNDLKTKNHIFEYNGHTAKSILFCEGFRVTQNPFFNDLPLVPAKGDLLTIRCKPIPQDHMINSNFFMIPMGDGLFKVGSTYEWDFTDYQPNPKSKQQLTDKLDALLLDSYEVINHESAVRPASKDRRPFMGFHAKNPNIGVFNGFGTKAYSLVPYFAKHFANHIVKEESLMDEIHINRFNY